MKKKMRSPTKTSNTEGRSTYRTNTRGSSHRNPRRKGMKKQKIPTVISSGGY